MLWSFLEKLKNTAHNYKNTRIVNILFEQLRLNKSKLSFLFAKQMHKQGADLSAMLDFPHILTVYKRIMRSPISIIAVMYC